MSLKSLNTQKLLLAATVSLVTILNSWLNDLNPGCGHSAVTAGGQLRRWSLVFGSCSMFLLTCCLYCHWLHSGQIININPVSKLDWLCFQSKTMDQLVVFCLTLPWVSGQYARCLQQSNNGNENSKIKIQITANWVDLCCFVEKRLSDYDLTLLHWEHCHYSCSSSFWGRNYSSAKQAIEGQLLVFRAISESFSISDIIILSSSKHCFQTQEWETIK